MALDMYNTGVPSKVLTPEKAAESVKEKAQLFRDANNFKPVKRIPHMGAFISWKILDAGYKYSEAFNDYEIFEYCQRYFLDRYEIDSLMGNAYCMPFRVMEAMGKGYFYYSDESETVGVEQYSIANPDNFMEFADDWNKMLWEYSCPNKFPDWKNKDLAYFQNAVNEHIVNMNHFMKMCKMLTDEYGLPLLNSMKVGGGEYGAEKVFKHLLGIKGFSIALRRNYEQIKEFAEKIDTPMIDGIVKQIHALPKDEYDMTACYDVGVLLLAHTVMNPKQFGELYWKPIKRVLDATQECNKHARVTIEGSGMHIFDYFADYPKGVYTLTLEQDDVFETHAKLPNAGIMGGMPTVLLGNGTPQECVDQTKKVIDELDGFNGGLVFSEDKFISYRHDCDPENLLAVCKFLHEYTA